ncbi:hypothetical protein Q9233_002585 [Columba guinea]|nr:hypothetical protein Q9233_002585 [Columba guinea]
MEVWLLQLSLMDSRDFEFMHANTRFTACLCPDSAKTFFWDVKATKLGNSGKGERARQAEGLLEEKTHTSLLCPKGTSASETIAFTMPENVVLGSERAHISFLVTLLFSVLWWLQGAVEEGLGMSSVIITALIHSGMPRSDPVVWKALKCIRDLVNADTGSSNLYSLALAANAFAVAGDKALRQKILKRLDEMATISDDQIFWSQQSKQEQDSLYWYRAPSADVELTSSILMAHLSKSTLSSDEIRKVSQIVSWLIKQQNPYGGFASTQDTVVALEALALYASKTFNKDGPNLQASLSSEGFSQNVRVDNTNRLLLQTVELPTIPQVYRVHVQGQGCLFLQAILRYHIPPSRSDITFAMSLQTECTAPNASQFSVTIHARYTGNRVSTNMVLIQVELLSGYSPVAGSLEELKKMPLVKKVESEADRVILYLEEMTRQPHTYTLLVQQDMQVMDHKPANIKVYDYYMPVVSHVTVEESHGLRNYGDELQCSMRVSPQDGEKHLLHKSPVGGTGTDPPSAVSVCQFSVTPANRQPQHKDEKQRENT